jgi:hypothetical protein
MNKLLIIVFILICLNLLLFNKENFTENKKKNLTIVTAYFKVNRTRVADGYTNGRKKKDMPKDSDGIYKEWMKGLLSYNGPMIIYTDEYSFDYITNLRKNYPKTKIIKTTISELDAYKYFKDLDNTKKYPTMIWKEHDNNNINRDLYTIWNSKFSMLKDSVKENPFDTKYFAWFDIGYIRDKKTLESEWPDENKLKILDDKILFNIVYGGPECTNKNKGSVTGGFIGCNKTNIFKIYDLFILKLKKISKEKKFSGNDQTLYQQLRCENTDLIKGVKGLKTEYWKHVPHHEWFYMIPYFYKKTFKTIEKFVSY